MDESQVVEDGELYSKPYSKPSSKKKPRKETFELGGPMFFDKAKNIIKSLINAPDYYK